MEQLDRIEAILLNQSRLFVAVAFLAKEMAIHAGWRPEAQAIQDIDRAIGEMMPWRLPERG